MPQSTTFADLEIGYDERVLRPRAWTQAQARWAAELLLADDAPPGPVLELCSGAGQIGLLTVLLASRPLVCVDSSPVACRHARRNADAAGLAALVDVRERPLDAALGEGERFALALADPPWVPHDEIDRFPEDPPGAIDGGADGLDAARACLRVAAAHLVPGGTMILQLGSREQAEVLRREAAPLAVEEVREEHGGVLVRLSLDRAG